MCAMWMVRASGGKLIGDFLDRSLVGIGFAVPGDVSGCQNRGELRECIHQMSLTNPRTKIAAGTNYLSRFLWEVQIGDRVITYDKTTRTYLIGSFCSEYSFDPSRLESHPHIRNVEWTGSIGRDELSSSAKRSLGAQHTIFLIQNEIAEEIERKRCGQIRPVVIEDDIESEIELDGGEDEGDDSARHFVAEEAHEKVKDVVANLAWDDMQELVAGILRAMGYKTRVSAKGADRGRDIVASPDGLGLEQPRIVVEVKHQKAQIGAPLIRSFLGGLSQTDRGLYVSTGGYTKEARYEADRANPPVTLLDLDELVALLTEHYGQADQEVRTLVPLTPIYWPVR